MANQIKLTDVVRSFNGDRDFAEWVSKFELACDLRNLVDGRHKLLPMFLEGPAFAVYKQLSDAQHADYNQLKDALIGSFCEDCFAAYGSLQGRKLQAGESVDVYLAELKRLISLCEKGEVPKGMLRCAFVSGLPRDVQVQVLALPGVAEKSAEQLLSTVKSVVSAASKREDELCAAGRVVGGGSTRNSRASGGRGPIRCYKCGVEGHIASRCGSAAIKEGTGCYRCGSTTHYIRDCSIPAPAAGNGRVEASSAPAASTK